MELNEIKNKYNEFKIEINELKRINADILRRINRLENYIQPIFDIICTL